MLFKFSLRLLAIFLYTTPFALPAHAEEGMKRSILHQADLSGAPGMEVISSTLEVRPGTLVPNHFHHGIETGQVLEGAMIQFPGKEPQMMATGTPLFSLRGIKHAGFTVVGDKPLKLYTVHIVDKGKPLFDGAADSVTGGVTDGVKKDAK